MSGRGFLILILGLLIGGLAVQLPRWLDGQADSPRETFPLDLSDVNCDPVRGPCTALSGEVRLALHLQGPVIGLRPFRVQLVAAGARFEEAQLEFDMAGMDMGRNRYRLLQEGNAWVGVVTLPVCTTGRSDWRATVRVGGAGREWVAVFPFEMQAR